MEMKIQLIIVCGLISLFRFNVATAVQPTLNFTLTAPRDLIVKDPSKIDSNHVKISRALSGSQSFTPYAAGTTIKQDQLNASLWEGNAPVNLFGVSKLIITGKKDSNGTNFSTSISISIIKKPCIFQERHGDNVSGDTIYTISILFGSNNSLEQLYKTQKSQICAQATDKLTFDLGNIVGGFLLPAHITTYGLNGQKKGIPKTIYIAVSEH